MDFHLVGLKLLPGAPDGRVLVRHVLQLDHALWQSIDKQHHVGPALMPVLDDGELVDRKPIVGLRSIEVDHAGLRAAYRSVIGAVLNRDSAQAVATIRTWRHGSLTSLWPR